MLETSIGDQPLVPADVAERGTPTEIIKAGLERLAKLRRDRRRDMTSAHHGTGSKPARGERCSG